MKRVFLDYASTTPLDPRVAEVMREAEQKFWYNASSLYSEGESSRAVLMQARERIASILNCRSSEVFFTSGGTEGANLAMQGILKDAIQRLNLCDSIPHVIVSSIEHSAILEPLRQLVKEQRIELSIVAPNEKGIISAQSVERELKENTVLVCVMHANNEIGTLQPVGRIAAVVKEFRKNKKLEKNQPLLPYPYFFVDASQTPLYENVSIERLGADAMILDGIKMYGPRGAGVLVVKHGVGITPIIFGGGQEKGIRPGTENVVSALGLSKALEIANEMREAESTRLTELRDYAINKIISEIPGSSLNGDQEQRLPNNINICFSALGNSLGTPKEFPRATVDSEFLVIKLDTLGFAVSSASACLNLKDENSSYVIESLGKEDCAGSSLRFSLGRETTKDDLDNLVEALKKVL